MAITQSAISLSHKKFLFQKFLMHVICGTPIKNPGYAYVMVLVFLSKFFLEFILIDKNVGGL